MKQVQQAAAAAVQTVLSGANLPGALAAVFQRTALPERDQAAVRAYAYGTLRHLAYLRFALDKLARKRPKREEVVALLLVALYQLEFGRAAAYTVVDHAVDNVGDLGGPALKPFANAILRQYLRRREALLQAAKSDEVARYSYPAWWIAKLRSQLGDRAEDVLRVGNLHPPMTLRVNRRRIEPEAYLELLQHNGLSGRLLRLDHSPVLAVRLDDPVPVERLPGFEDGLVSVQDAGAQLAGYLLDVHPGQTVVDACAAPGGKTGHILELADVHMTALDADAARLGRVEQNLRRLGLQARLICVDAAAAQMWWDGQPVARVLLDAPCSASGVVRRHPDVKWLRREEDVAAFAQQQLHLLDAMWKVTARGGKLLYVTCSVFREENQLQVQQFLARHADAQLAPDHRASSGQLLLPTEEHDGFFHALFDKL